MTDPKETSDFDALPSFAPVGSHAGPRSAAEPPRRPAAAPSPRPARPPRPSPRPARRSRGRAALGVFAVAVCLVVGFVCGRLIGPYATQSSAAPEAVVPLSGTSAAPITSRVVIHYADSDAGRQAAMTLAEELSRAGYGTIEIRSQTTAVDGDRIRYFAASERDAAQALGDVVGRVLRQLGRASPQLQNFTNFAPKPPDGTLEIWLGAG